MPSLPVRFAREPLTDALWNEARPLLEQHWREIAHYPDIPLNPDRAMYDRVEATGALRFFTARSGDKDCYFCAEGLDDLLPVDGHGFHGGDPRGQCRRAAPGFVKGDGLVGYAVFFVRSNPHYVDSLQAVQDVLFLQPSQRGATGSRFIDWCDEQLAAEGVQAVYHHVKQAHNFGRMLERRGYELVDLIYAKRLDR